MIPVQIEAMGVARLWNRTRQGQVKVSSGNRKRLVDQVLREVCLDNRTATSYLPPFSDAHVYLHNINMYTVMLHNVFTHMPHPGISSKHEYTWLVYICGVAE